MTVRNLLIACVAVASLVAGCGKETEAPKDGAPTPTTIRLGYFPNLTHGPALVGVGDGTFEKELGPAYKLDTKVFNAGPEISEAMRANALDIAFVGPSPAINLYVKSEGKGVRVIAGACSGGASFVVRSGSTVKALKDLGGKKVAVPQLGNTQDISLRQFLLKEGLNSVDKGGTVEIIPVKNADILSLFKTNQIDAAWVPEPWGTRLVKEAGATRLIDERDLWPDKKFLTAVVVARYQFAQDHPEAVAAFAKANEAVVAWMIAHPAEAATSVNKQLKALSGKALPKDVLDESLSKLTFTTDTDLANLKAQAKAAQDCGYLKPSSVELDQLIYGKAASGP